MCGCAFTSICIRERISTKVANQTPLRTFLAVEGEFQHFKREEGWVGFAALVCMNRSMPPSALDAPYRHIFPQLRPLGEMKEQQVLT